MQFIESSIVGLRAAVITFRRRETPLRFVLFPMVHIAEQQFYDEVAARARACHFLLGEGVSAGETPAQSWMARHQRGHLVDQAAALQLETLGVPVRWEADPDARPQSAADRAKTHALDIAGAFTLVLGRKFIDPLLVSSVEQAEMYDESAENETGGWLDRLLEYNVSTVRNARLISLIDEIHRDRATEEIHVGVVFGARHMPAVAAHLGDPLGYVATDAEWLTVAHR